MDREFFYDKETRSELAAFNPYLKKDIEDARIALGMPKGGFLTSEEANKWYIEHYRRAKGKPPEPKNPWNWHLPKELVDMLDSFSYSAKPSRVNFDSDVPLDRYAMDLIHKFGLLEQMVAGLRSYIMMEKHNYPGIPGPYNQCSFPLMKDGKELNIWLLLPG